MNNKIAIIGTGISGLTCAHLLNRQHDITVYEANDYIGGHTATKKISDNGETYHIDTGFIVFNDWTYPNFIKLINQLNVEYQPTEMSFSVMSKKANLEYNGNNLNSLFAQRRNILRPKFWRIVKDILTFNKACKAMVAENRDTSSLTLEDVIRELKLSDDFARYYIFAYVRRNLVQQLRANEKVSTHVLFAVFQQPWLAQYYRPSSVVHN
tara:strand:+ start:1210 stop:1839 length:630 start_codon:yes stop_codon:yes gene_type:complete